MFSALRIPASRLLVATRPVVATARPVFNRRFLMAFAPTVSRLNYNNRMTREPLAPADPSPTLFVANLPWSIQEFDLEEKFSVYGEVDSVEIARNEDGRMTGWGRIKFVNLESSIAAFEAATQEPIRLLERDIRVDYSRPRTSGGANPPGPKLYFQKFNGGISEMREALGEYGNDCLDIFFLDKLDGSRDAGFLEFPSTELATEVLSKLNGATAPSGSTLTLAYAKVRQNNPRGGQRQQRGEGRPRQQYRGRSDRERY